MFEGDDTSELPILWNSDVFHYDLRGDSLGVWGMWQRGLIKLMDFGYF